jgi:Cu(I)/Ag(I) efflux system membrane fusion protein
VKKLVVVLLIVLAAFAGWFFGRGSTGSDTTGARKVLFYQSAMHPWIKSDKPGNCTICGMTLTPVYEGEKGIQTDANMVTLSSNAINVINVQTEVAGKRPIEKKLEVAGRVEADQTRTQVISAYVDGRVEKLFVNFAGAEVKEGEPLAVIYSPALLTAEREFLNVVGQTNFSNSPRLAQEHQRLVEGARQRLKRLGLTDRQIERVREAGAATNFTTQIVAPISGTVVKRDVFEGQYVKEGDRLFELIDLSQLWFVFEVYEQDLPAISLGQTVSVTSPALAGRTFSGPITFIEPTINEATRSARVRVELENPLIDGKRALYNGLYASGRIKSRSEPVLTVSRSAVIEPGDNARLYVDHGDGGYEQRIVELGRRGETYIEIINGLEAGDKVVTAGNLLLDSQAQINRVVSGSAPHQHQTNASPHEHTTAAPVSPEAREKLTTFLKAMHVLAHSLANDDVKTYNERAAELPVAQSETLDSLAQQVKESAASNLAEARKEFLPLSMAAAHMAETLRKQGDDIGVKIYKCPMYPRLGQNAFWVQSEGPLRNPFYGSEMLECGTEVK